MPFSPGDPESLLSIRVPRLWDLEAASQTPGERLLKAADRSWLQSRDTHHYFPRTEGSSSPLPRALRQGCRLSGAPGPLCVCCITLQAPEAGRAVSARSCCRVLVTELFPWRAQLAPTASSAAGAAARAGGCPGITSPAILLPQSSGTALLLSGCELSAGSAATCQAGTAFLQPCSLPSSCLLSALQEKRGALLSLRGLPVCCMGKSCRGGEVNVRKLLFTLISTLLLDRHGQKRRASYWSLQRQRGHRSEPGELQGQERWRSLGLGTTARAGVLPGGGEGLRWEMCWGAEPWGLCQQAR